MGFGNESVELMVDEDFNCCCSVTRTVFDIHGKPTIQIINSVLTIPTALTATLGNLLVLVSIWRTPSLHSPTNFLLFGLALSDFSVGLVVQPIFFVYNVAKIKGLPNLFCSSAVALGFTGNYLCGVSLLTLTAVSLDRYIALHLHLRYQELVTVKRVGAMVFSFWIACGINGVLYRWSPDFLDYSSVVVIFVCFSVITFAYCKIYRVVRRHQTQIQAAQAGQQQDSLNIAQFKKSFVSMLLIYLVFLFCYIPYILVRGVILSAPLTVSRRSILELTFMLVSVNSTVNPFVYFWRFQRIRVAVTETARKYLCKSS